MLRGFFKAGDLAAQTRDAGGIITDDDLQSFIQRDCEAVNSARGARWQLLPAVRRETVQHLGADAARLLETTEGIPADAADLGRTMAESYLRGQAPGVGEQTPDQLAGSLLAVRWLSEPPLHLPTEGTLQSQLHLAALLEPLRSVTDGPFVGRHPELARLAEYVVRPDDHPWRPLVIYGPGGMGKSTVVARFVLDRSGPAQAGRLPFTYLTFDRPELLPQRPLGLLAEMIRQLSLQDPRSGAGAARTVAALEQTQRSVVGSEREQSVSRSGSAGVNRRHQRDERELVEQFATIVNSIPAESVLCVLDTFERAQRQGPAAVNRLWQTLDAARSLAPRLRIVIVGPRRDHRVSGRETSPRRPGSKVRGAVSAHPGGGLDVDEPLLEAVARRVGGNP